MRKTVIFLIAAILIIAPTKSTYADTILYTQAKSNLRAGPSTKHKIVKVLSLGESIRVGPLAGNWYEVLNSKNGTIKWVAGMFDVYIKTTGSKLLNWKWGYVKAQPIHWIIAALIALSKADEKEDG